MGIDEILEANIDDEVFDWITWETLGNPSEDFRKSNAQRQFGLWRANYEVMAQGGKKFIQPDWVDGALGRGYLRVYTLSEIDYNDHKELIKTFLPCMKVDPYNNGQLIDPFSRRVAFRGDRPSDYVIFPYNVDDNDRKSLVLGTNLDDLKHLDAKMLAATLPRWSTASRSSIVPFGDDIDVLTPGKTKFWKQRDVGIFIKPEAKEKFREKWVLDHLDKNTFEDYKSKKKAKFYSVKTGVQWVGMEDQSGTGKSYLEDGYDLAMNRSNLVAWMRNVYGEGALETRYQIELLTVVVDRAPGNDAAEHKWDGFQVRDLGDSTGQAWFPATAIPNNGSAFAMQFGETTKFEKFWTKHFAEPLGRAKAEMLIMFGLQLQGNAQNMLVSFDKSSKKSQLIVRDIGDALINDYIYEALDTVGAFNNVVTLERNSGRGFFVAADEQGAPNDAMPRMTRIGTALLFFFGPFVKGNVTVDIATRMAISHHFAFLAYMKERIGYTFDGSLSSGDVPEGLKDFLLLCADNYKYDMRSLKGEAAPTYSKLVKAVLACPSSARYALYEELREETISLMGRDTAIGTMRSLCAAQDMLIGADLQTYLVSKAGKKALKALHSKLSMSKAVVLYTGR